MDIERLKKEKEKLRKLEKLNKSPPKPRNSKDRSVILKEWEEKSNKPLPEIIIELGSKILVDL